MPAKGTTKKKTTAKKSPGTKKGITKKSPSRTGKSTKKIKASSNSPFYVLTIMGLLTVIVIMLNKYNVNSSNIKSNPKKEIITSKDLAKNAELVNNTDRTHIESAEKDEPAQNEMNFVNAKIYFIKLNETTEKLYLSSVKRKVNKKTMLEESLHYLISGPRGPEKKRGLLTAVSDNIKIRNIKVRNKIAEIDFNSAIERNAGGDILLRRIDQIVYTATQFAGIDSIVIKINGRKRRTLGSDGLSINGPIHRRI